MRMRTTWLRMRIINLEELFWKFGAKLAKKTEFIPARPDHQNVKKIRKFFLVKIIVSKVTLSFSYLTLLIYNKFQNWNGKLTLYFDFLCLNFMLKFTILYLFCLLYKCLWKIQTLLKHSFMQGVGIKRWNWMAETETENGNWNGDKTLKWGYNAEMGIKHWNGYKILKWG